MKLCSQRGTFVELFLYSHAQCGLCDRLEQLLEHYLKTTCKHTEIKIVKRDINNNPRWQELYKLRIPVLEYRQQIILEGRPSNKEIANALNWIIQSNTELTEEANQAI